MCVSNSDQLIPDLIESRDVLTGRVLGAQGGGERGLGSLSKSPWSGFLLNSAKESQRHGTLEGLGLVGFCLWCL